MRPKNIKKMKDFENVKEAWKDSKKKHPSTSNADDIFKKAKRNYKGARKQHLLNILILALTCVGLTAFFYFVAPLQEMLSRVGIALMIGGLIIRILIETHSYQKAHSINYNVTLLQSANQATSFYQWRKTIHGPVTFTIVALYTIGFYILTPEFSRYLSLPWVIAMDTSYLVLAVVLFFQIRKGVVKEMEHLKVLIDIQDNAKREK